MMAETFLYTEKIHVLVIMSITKENQVLFSKIDIYFQIWSGHKTIFECQQFPKLNDLYAGYIILEWFLSKSNFI